MESSPTHDVAAMAAILLSAITELCILHHISWTKHDNTEKATSPPDVLMVKDYSDTIYYIINCSGEGVIVKFCYASCNGNTSAMMLINRMTHEYSAVITASLHKFSVTIVQNTPTFILISIIHL